MAELDESAIEEGNIDLSEIKPLDVWTIIETYFRDNPNYKSQHQIDSFNEFLLKIVSIRNINIDVYINDFFYPPFNDQKIEYVRNYMAKIGNLNLSRVSNKSIKN